VKKQYREVRLEAIANRAAALKAAQLEKLLHFEQGRTFPVDYRAVNAGVISFPSGPFMHSLIIDRGSSSGIRMSAPVVSGDGLVGHVSKVFSHTAFVTLLTDPDSFVAARDIQTRVRGGVKPGPGGSLQLAEVPKEKVVHAGDTIVTDGTRSARYPDLYPYGIPIGRVSSKGAGALDTATFLQVQVQPFANLGSLDAVAVLVSKNPRR
jgi:rod shape-determining protein MreC